MTLLECSNLIVGYEGKGILAEVNLSLKPGQVTALLGPNGGGKTTLLKTLSGLMPPVQGEVKIDGVQIKELSQKQIATKIAYVPQDEDWKFSFTVAQMVAMGRIPRSNGYFETAEDQSKAEDAMVRAGCRELANRIVTELSGGERQRVMIARALAQETKILFLDEPTAHLDPKHQTSISALIRTLAGDGIAILLAMHDLPAVAETADFGILIASGQATRSAPIQDVLMSNALDNAYETFFERIERPGGGLVVLPQRRP